MGGPEASVYRWHEPPARRGTVLLLASAAAGLLALAVVSLVVDNWDVSVGAGALGVAAGADLWRDLRPRAFVLAGAEGVVVGTGRRTTVLSWSEVARLRTERRWRRDRPVLERTDGTVVRLPSDVPLPELERRWPRPA